MNKRIEELIEQAWSETEFDDPRSFAKRLAELMVIETLNVQEALISQGHNAWHLRKETLKYFGVNDE